MSKKSSRRQSEENEPTTLLNGHLVERRRQHLHCQRSRTKSKNTRETYEEAIKNALEVIELWLEVAIQDGRPIPPPQKYVA
jgi:hypothetical protein